MNAGNKDLSLKQDYTLSLTNDSRILFGFNSILHHFSPGEITSESMEKFKIPEKQALENAITFSQKIRSCLN
jgi:hypothetical protein